jgi:hypothetical protein
MITRLLLDTNINKNAAGAEGVLRAYLCGNYKELKISKLW